MESTTPAHEIDSRINRYRQVLPQYLPQAEGSLIFSRLNIFYFTGTFANGVLWIPSEGNPILFCRRGAERARLESPLENIVPFNSYGDIVKTFSALNITMPVNIAAEMSGLPWSLSNSLKKYFPETNFSPCDRLIAMTRAKKSEWELKILREAGARHHKCLAEILPACLHEGISELEISHKISEIFYAEGNYGVLRMENFGEDAFLGHISIGDSANYPSYFNGPVGLRGVHPAAPFMGAEHIRWESGSPLIIDNAFSLAGYHTDKTQVYWLGSKNTIPGKLLDAHKFCVEMQNMAAEKLRSGAIPSELWKECETMAAKSPWADGFMGFGGNKVSFLGHGIGLAIDEWPVIAKGFDQPLEEGMVLAIEPKIGIPGVGMVGTENTFELTPAGGRSLTGTDDGIIFVD